MEIITKTGIVTKIEQDGVKVRVQSCSACQGCAVRSACQMSESADKEVFVAAAEPHIFSIGEEVNLSISSNQGLKAVFLGYGLPLILFLAAIVVARIMGFNDFYSGICGIFILIPYYLGVFLLKNKIKLKFQFDISKKVYSEDAK